MSKFRNWLEKWFGIPAEEKITGASDQPTTSSGPEKSGEFHILRVQPTPNPHAFQFVISAPVIASGTRTFESADDAKGDHFAEALFQIFGVENIYLKENFVTITKSETVGWNTVFEKIGETIENKITFYETPDEEEPVGTEPESILDKFHKEDFPSCNEEEKALIIEAMLDQAIRPSLPNDGGGLDVLGIEGNVVKIHYQGACGTCPSSTTGTLNYIETFLKDSLHPDLVVQAQ
jgi:Fe-S cluster biogenesis protein NfuA